MAWKDLDISMKNLRVFLSVFFPLAGIQMAIAFGSSFGNFFLVQMGLTEQIAAMAVCETFFSLILRPVVASVFEIGGVVIARQFGASHYQRMAASSQKVLLLMWTIIAIFAVPVIFAENVMSFMGFSPQLSRIGAYYAQLTFPVIILEFMAQSTQVFLVSQNVTEPFKYFPVFMVFQSLVVNLFFVKFLNLGGLGVITARMVHQLCNFVMYQVRMITRCHPETAKWASLAATFKDFFHFIKKISYSVVVHYGDTFAYYFGILLLTRTNNNLDFAAWYAIDASQRILYYLSQSFANTNRTMIGQLMGQGNWESARNQAIVNSIYNYVFSSVLGLTLVAGSTPISHFLSDIPAFQARMAIGFIAIGFFLPFFLQTFPAETLFRITNLDSFMMWMSGLVYPLLVAVFILFFYVRLQWGLFAIFLGFNIGCMFVCFVYWLQLFSVHDWENDTGDRAERVSLISTDSVA